MRTYFLLLLPLVLGFFSCEEQEELTSLTDEAFVESLATDPNAEEVTYAALPPSTQENLEREHFETFAETIQRVPGRGFIIQLASGETLYARLDGSFVEYQAEFRPGGAFALHPHGRCFRRLRRFGQPIPLADLSTTITDYVTTNYPDAEIRRAKVRGDSTLVAITGATVILFGGDDEFIREYDVLSHCSIACIGVRPAIRVIVNEYITTNYTDLTVRRVCRWPNRIFVVGNNGGERLILIFDTEGNFLEERP